MLDQLTDRLATLALCMCLCIFYPEWLLFWQLMAVIDIGSHWLHMHSHDLVGSSSHKNVDAVSELVFNARDCEINFNCCADHQSNFATVLHITPVPLLHVRRQ